MKPFPKLDNIHAISIPLPGRSNLITTNAFIVGKRGITLIDTGLKVPGALESVRRELVKVGSDIFDIERIIFTHGHMDHFGLAASICKAVGHAVECFIHAEDRPSIASDNFLKEMSSKEAEKLMTMAGMPVDERARVREYFAAFKEFADPLDNASSLKGGEEFRGGDYQLKIIHTPGHTPGSCCIYEEKTRILFSGDSIIKNITPNPLVVIKREWLRDKSYLSLNAFNDSLDRLYDLDILYAFPGHGEYVEDTRAIISSYKRHYNERKELVWRSLNGKTWPIYRLIADVFPFIPEGDEFLAVSEVLVHLESLAVEGKVELVDCGPPALYRVR
ncbi:MAG: MBL fold metallo-hydrolase [Desulfobacteraceae bacterium]|nr:MAG: MBL fold metallo-hydrolase [Desulfobacteraceae bacterium]